MKIITIFSLVFLASLEALSQPTVGDASAGVFANANVQILTITNVTGGLTNWWKFDENTGTTASDSADSATGTFNNGNTAWVAAGKIGACITNGGASAYINLSTNDGLALTGGAMTASFWMQPNAIMGSSGSGTVIYDSNGGASAGWWLQVNTNSIEYHFISSSGADARRIGTVSLPTNAWTHVLGTWDGTTDATHIHIYTNGVEVGSYSSTQNGGAAMGIYNGTSRYIGITFGGNNVYYGLLDDLRIYSRVLNATEISYVYQWNGQP